MVHRTFLILAIASCLTIGCLTPIQNESPDVPQSQGASGVSGDVDQSNQFSHGIADWALVSILVSQALLSGTGILLGLRAQRTGYEHGRKRRLLCVDHRHQSCLPSKSDPTHSERKSSMSQLTTDPLEHVPGVFGDGSHLAEARTL